MSYIEASPKSQLPAPLERASLSAADLLAEVEDNWLALGSYTVDYRELREPFGIDEMSIAHVQDSADGFYRAAWAERMPDTDVTLAFDFEWSVNDEGYRWAEIKVIDFGKAAATDDGSHGRIPMNQRHMAYLDRTLRRFAKGRQA